MGAIRSAVPNRTSGSNPAPRHSCSAQCLEAQPRVVGREHGEGPGGGRDGAARTEFPQQPKAVQIAHPLTSNMK